MKKKSYWWIGKEDLLIRKYAPWRELEYSMVNEINDTVYGISQAETIDHIEKALATFCDAHGISGGGYLCVGRDGNGFFGGSQVRYESSDVKRGAQYPVIYFSEKIIDIDAYRFLTTDCVYPVPFGLPHHMKFESPEERKYMSVRNDFGYGTSLQISFNTPHWNCTFGTTIDNSEGDFIRRLPRLAAQIQIFGIALHDAIRRVSPIFKGSLPSAKAEFRLTRRELECLHWAASGKTAWEISCILNISERTVVTHTENAKKKLGANTLPQAVGRAVSLALITL